MTLLEALTRGPAPTAPRGKIAALLARLQGTERDLVVEHLRGDVSAEWLSAALAQGGEDISPSTIRTYRRAVRREDV